MTSLTYSLKRELSLQYTKLRESVMFWGNGVKTTNSFLEPPAPDVPVCWSSRNVAVLVRGSVFIVQPNSGLFPQGGVSLTSFLAPATLESRSVYI